MRRLARCAEQSCSATVLKIDQIINLYILFNYKMELLKISNKYEDLICLKIKKRPSSIIKSPYVADCILFDHDTIDEDNEEADKHKPNYLLYTPGLGCGGLVVASNYVYGVKSSTSSKTQYTAMMTYCEDSEGIYYVGVHPMISQKACLVYLQTTYKDYVWNSEVTLTKETRIDFVGTQNETGKKFYVEVKNAMVSYESDRERKDRRALFPEASKRTLKPVSERALKHANTLKDLLKEETTEKCMLLYTVPRSDCKAGVVINPNDVTYAKAVKDAESAGVCLNAIGMKFDLSGIVKFTSELSVHYQ